MTLPLRIGSILYFVLLILLVQWFGHGVGALVLPKNQRDDLPFWAPLLGMGAASLLTGYLSYMGFSCNQIRWFVPPLLGGISLLTFRKEDLKLYRGVTGGILLTAFAGGGLVLAHSLFWNGIYPYTDTFTYVSIADRLRSYGFFDRTNFDFFHPFLTQVRLYQNGFRMGSQFFLGLTSALFRVPYSLEMYLPVAALGHFMFITGMWLFCRRVLRFAERPAWLACLLAAVNFSLLLKSAYLGFLPQAYGLGLYLYLMVWLFAEGPSVFDFRRIFLGGLLSALLVFTYSELVPFWGLTCGLFLFSHFREPGRGWDRWKGFLSAGALAVVINPVAFLGMLKVLPVQMNAVVGWNVPLSLWEILNACLSFHRLEGPLNSIAVWNGHPHLYFLSQVLAVSVVILIFVTALKTDNLFTKIRPALLSVAPILVVMFIMATLKLNPFVSGLIGQSWSVFKALQYAFFIFPPLLAISIDRSLIQGGRAVSRFAPLFILALVLPGVGFAVLHTKSDVARVGQTVGCLENPIQSYYDLRSGLPKGDDPLRLMIPSEFLKHRQMVAYFLQDRSLVADWSDDGYINNSLPRPPADLRLSEFNLLVMDAKKGGEGVSLPCRLSLLSPSQIGFTPSYTNGWYDSEENGVEVWRWSGGEGTFSFSPPIPLRTNFEISFSCQWADPQSISNGKALRVMADSVSLGQVKPHQPGWNPFKLKCVLESETSSLTLHYDGRAVRLGADPRNLAFRIKDFEVKKIADAALPRVEEPR